MPIHPNWPHKDVSLHQIGATLGQTDSSATLKRVERMRKMSEERDMSCNIATKERNSVEWEGQYTMQIRD